MKSFATFMVIAMVVLGTALTASAQAPANIWFEADAISGLTNGEAVATWPDSSPGGNDLTTTAGTPTYLTGVVNGQPVVDFATADVKMWATNHPSMNVTNWTFFTVLKVGDTVNNEVFFMRDDGNGTEYAFQAYASGGGNYAYVKERNDDAVAPGDYAACRAGTDSGLGWHVHTGWFDRSLFPNISCINIYRDGTLDIAGSIFHLTSGGPLNPVTSGDFHVGWNYPYTIDPRHFRGQVAEIAAIPYAASAQDILDVNAYLGAKYGITVAGGGDAGNGYKILVGTAVSATPGTLIYGK